MKKIILLAFISLLFIQCNSVKNHNKHLNDLLSEQKLQSDVDYIYAKLQKLHPNLYWYISKENLDYKFDSLKKTITKPMNRFAFYTKLSPVLASIRQGHLFVYPYSKMFTKKESKALVKKGVGPFSQFEFEVFDNKMYVVKNKSYDKSIQKGFEVVAINGKNPMELTANYSKWFTSDGYNQTFKKARLGKYLPTFYTNENGVQDSVIYNFKYHDSIKIVTIKRKVTDTAGTNKKAIKKVLTELEKANIKAKKKADKKEKSVFGYDESTKSYNRNLRFLEKDSTVAVMKIKGFSNGNYNTFYEESFSKLNQHKTKTLVLDLRDNPGGRLSEIAELYSYLSDSTFVFLEPSEVVSKTSLFHADYFKGGSLGIKALKIVFSPLYYGYTFFKVHKKENGKYYYNSESTPQKIKKDAFKGKLYVLINGGSFSASCIISSNLKGAKRATFVGEETGGAYNGTVAGQMPILELPNSKIKVRVGLVAIVPHYKSNLEGHGVFPDIEIVPTLEDKIKDIDVEMNWVLEDLKKNQSPQKEVISQNTN
jgi:C-terminal processing protease CtpA/Prc